MQRVIGIVKDNVKVYTLHVMATALKEERFAEDETKTSVSLRLHTGPAKANANSCVNLAVVHVLRDVKNVANPVVLQIFQTFAV